MTGLQLKNPAKTLQTLPQLTGGGEEKAGELPAKMEKVREYMMKLCIASSDKPLSEAQNSRILKRLNEILPLLQHTPDHPPYAWANKFVEGLLRRLEIDFKDYWSYLNQAKQESDVGEPAVDFYAGGLLNSEIKITRTELLVFLMIEKTIQELAEKGGSSEESISKYIRKKHKDLPWAHDTFLRHHLKCLCESGDIVLTSNHQYAFPSSHPALNSRKISSKKLAKGKRDCDWNKNNNKKQKKEVGKDHLEQRNGEAQLIGEERPSCEPGNREDSKEAHEMQIVDICSSDAQLNTKEEQLDDDHTDNPTQEKPPGFKPVLKTVYSRKRHPGSTVVAPKLLRGKGEEMHTSVDNGLKQVQSLPLEEFKPIMDETSVPESQHVPLGGANQGPRIVYQYKRRPGEKGKPSQGANVLILSGKDGKEVEFNADSLAL